MKWGNGIVKKYSREYNRTLKNGERKKYTTEQIQITVPKNEDIYENREEVLIIPSSEIEEFKSREEEIENLKIANYLHAEEVNELEKQLNQTDKPSAAEYENEISALKESLDEVKTQYEELITINEENESVKDRHSKLIVENENLKTKFVNIKAENENLKTKYTSMKEENKNLKNKCSALKESYNSVSTKYDHLKQENLNTKTGYAEIYEMNESLEKDYDLLLNDYNELVDRFNDLQEELYDMKTHQSRDDYLANKVKEFMLSRG